MYRFQAPVVVLLCALFPAFGAGASEPAAEAAPEAALADTFDELIAEARRNGDVSVILGLKERAAPGRLKRKGRLSRRAWRERKVEIAERQQSVTRALAGRARGMYRYRNIPFLGLRADAQTLEALRVMPQVESFMRNGRHSVSLASSTPAMGAPGAWAAGFEGVGQAVAVIDTGVEGTHPFFEGRILGEAEACFSNTLGESGVTGFCDTSPGLIEPCTRDDGNGGRENIINSACGPGAADPCTGHSQCDHGTHVAGIVLGRNAGFSGVARAADLIPIQAAVLEGSALVLTDADLLAALDHVLDLKVGEGMDIAAVNMSLGGGRVSSQVLCDALYLPYKRVIDDLRAAGVATVVASGNESDRAKISYPGCISSAVSVGSTRDSGSVSNFSNYASWLSVFAPGENVYSSVTNGGYANKSGTSMATPHVAGAIAVLKGKSEDGALGAGVDELLAALRQTGVLLTTPYNGYVLPRIQLDDALASMYRLDSLPQQVILPTEIILDSHSVDLCTGQPLNALGNLPFAQVDCSPPPAEPVAAGTLDPIPGFEDIGAYGGDAIRGLGATGTNQLRFIPELPTAGLYRISSWWPKRSSNSTVVGIDVGHAGGLFTEAIDQKNTGGGWREHGVFELAGDGSDYVEVYDCDGRLAPLVCDGVRAVADAVRFELIPPLVIDVAGLPRVLPGENLQLSLTARGGTPPYQWEIISDNPPSWLTLNSSTGVLFADPVGAAGSYDIDVRLMDSSGFASTDYSFTLSVSPFVGRDFGQPTVQNPQTDGVTLIWWTLVADGASWTLETARADTEPLAWVPSAVTYVPELVELTVAGGTELRHKHEIRIEGLEAGVHYLYRLKKQGEVLFESRFTTAPANLLTPVRVLVWADPEARPGQNSPEAGAPTGTMSQAAALRASVLASSLLDPDLVLVAGDLVDTGHDLGDWDELFRNINAFDFDPVTPGDEVPLASRVPFQAVLGNHDYRLGSLNPAENFLQHLANPGNQDPTLYTDPAWPRETAPDLAAAQNERYFSLRYGPATVIGLDLNNQSPDGSDLDTDFGMLGENEGGDIPDFLPGSRQYRWLEEQLQKAERESLFTFVYFHQAPYSSGAHGAPPGVDTESGVPVRRLVDLFHKYGVDATFSGHDEAFERSETRGDPDRGGDPAQVMSHFVLPSVADGVFSKVSDLLNPHGVFHYDDTAFPGPRYGMLQLDIDEAAGDPREWQASMRVLWLNDAWEALQAEDPIGGYYDEESPQSAFTARSGIHLPLIFDSETSGSVSAGSFAISGDGPDAYNARSKVSDGTEINRYRFTLDGLPGQLELHRLHAYWPAAQSNADSATVEIRRGCGMDAADLIASRPLNQRIQGDQWNALGLFYLDAADCVDFVHTGPGMAVDAIRLEQVRDDRPYVASVSLPDAEVGAEYSAALDVIGGTTGYSWSLVEGEGALPEGLTLASGGTISGTPVRPQIARFTVQVADGGGHISRQPLRITVGGNNALLIERFDSGNLNDWRLVDEGTVDAPSDWSAETGILVQSSNIHVAGNGEERPGTHLVYDEASAAAWTSYRVSFTARAIDDDRFGLLFRYQDEDNYYRFSWKRAPDDPLACIPDPAACAAEPSMQLIKRVAGVSTVIAEVPLSFYQQELSYRLEVEALGPLLKVRRDGEIVLEAVDIDLVGGTIAFSANDQRGVQLDDLVVEDLAGVNVPPVILSATATPPFIFDDETSQLQVQALNPDDSPQALTYRWTLPPEAGSLDDSTLAMPVFSPAPISGVVMTWVAEVAVSDGVSTVTESVQITVQDADLLLEETFDDGDFASWTVVDEGTQSAPSNWWVESAALRQTSNIMTGGTYPHNPGTYLRYEDGGDWGDYRVSATLSSTDDDLVGVMFRVQGGDYYRFDMARQASWRRLVKVVGGVAEVLYEDDIPYVQGQTYAVEITVEGTQIEVRVDGALITSVTDSDLSQGTIALYSFGNEGGYYDDILVERVGDDGPVNQAPVIQLVSASPNTLLDSETSQLQVTATDADFGPQLLSYQWTVPGGGGSLDDATSAAPVYTPADVTDTQVVTLGVEVTDGEDTASASVDVTVHDADAAPLLLEETFDDGDFVGWTVVDEGTQSAPSNWWIEAGVLRQTSNIMTGGTYPHNPGTYLRYEAGGDWSDYRVSVTLSSTDDDLVGIMFRVQDGGYYRFDMARQASWRRLVKVVGGVAEVLYEDDIPYVQGQTYAVEITVEGTQIEVRVDGVLITSVTDSDLFQGTIALYSFGNDGGSYDDVMVDLL